MTRHDEIRASYRKLGNSADFYDGIITRSTLIGKLVDSIVWGLNRELAAKWVNDALSSVPEDFAGKLLEVPVGTGVLTMPLYRTLPDASITCLDYSEDMMENARKRAEEMKLNNVSFVQGDVGALPFTDESFDLVLSLNGFHAFPDKDAAFRETFRVLKSGGIFCGCFYIAGEFRRTDLFVRRFYEPKGFFTPPFETKESLTAIDGTPVAYTGEYYVGANATEIVEAMKKNPFQIDLTVEEYMRKILDKIGKADYVLTEDDAALEFLNLLAKLNYASFEEQEVPKK